MLYPLRYYWRLAKGHRLRPWRSPLVRWRLETFFGIHADDLGRQQFFSLLWENRRRVLAFLRWTEEMESNQKAEKSKGLSNFSTP
ncbi:MAG TPA: hypothetical protein VNN18_11460 [Candidatus Xenobia bacterium]|nr:hypothetical protein [Candidatus Xenobia bacterium]